MTNESVAKRSQHVLIRSEAAYRVTHNGIYAWFAIWWCIANRREMPRWVTEYLIDAATAIMAAARDKKAKPTRRHQDAAVGLKLRPPSPKSQIPDALKPKEDEREFYPFRGKNIFKAFDDLARAENGRHNLHVYTALQLIKPRRRKTAIGGRDDYRAIDLAKQVDDLAREIAAAD